MIKHLGRDDRAAKQDAKPAKYNPHTNHEVSLSGNYQVYVQHQLEDD